jgi:ATP-dependent exoDNAse (exonuclease V) alpha subunit
MPGTAITSSVGIVPILRRRIPAVVPILNAFALTIHKVQGLSLPSITLALNKNIFSQGQAYVGLSRARTLDQVFLTQLDFDAIKADPEAVAEYDRLRTMTALLET